MQFTLYALKPNRLEDYQFYDINSQYPPNLMGNWKVEHNKNLKIAIKIIISMWYRVAILLFFKVNFF